MSGMDDKRIIMTLLQFNNLFKNKLSSKINKNELDEFFFWLIDHYCNFSKMNYILNSNYKISKNEEIKLISSIDLLKNAMPIQYVIGQTNFMD